MSAAIKRWRLQTLNKLIARNPSRSLQTLAYEEIKSNNSSSDKPYTATAFVLHGLLGSSRNWRSFSKNLLSSLSNSSSPLDWRMVLVDLRNHGRSADIKDGIFPPHDLVNSAKDLADLVEAKGWEWPDVVMGHSLGGKVALQFVESCARGDYGNSAVLPKQLWVLDSVVGEVDPENSNGEVEKVLLTLKSLPPIPSRMWLVDHMMKLGFSKSLSEWIGTNLKNSGDNQTWAFNLDGAVEMFNSYREKSYWNLLENPPDGLHISIVRAENSDRWSPDVVEQLENLAAKSEGKLAVPVLPKSGHWVHVDNPNGLLDIIAPSIKILS